MGKKCFIITPIGEKNSEIFRHIEGVINAVIKPLLTSYGFDDIKAAHEIDEPGSINNQLINRILEDDLVIANLTGNNANVMYELAMRHAIAKPIIHICEEGTKLPFDISNERTIFYTNDIMGTIELTEGIKRFLDKISYEKKYFDNPIYNAKQRALIIENISEDNPLKIILEMIEDLKKEVARNSKVSSKDNYISIPLETASISNKPNNSEIYDSYLNTYKDLFKPTQASSISIKANTPNSIINQAIRVKPAMNSIDNTTLKVKNED